MSYPPQQPGGWSDPSWPTSNQPYSDPGYSGYSAPPADPYAGYQAPAPYDPAAAYGPNPGYGHVAPEVKNNGLAIASLVVSIASILTCGVAGILGAILGHVARKQIRERGEAGDGLALAGIIVGYVFFAIALVMVALIALAWDTANSLPDSDSDPYPYAT